MGWFDILISSPFMYAWRDTLTYLFQPKIKIDKLRNCMLCIPTPPKQGRYCIRTLPRGGMYWEINPRCPRDFPRHKRFPEGNVRGKSWGCREILRAEGRIDSVKTNPSLLMVRACTIRTLWSKNTSGLFVPRDILNILGRNMIIHICFVVLTGNNWKKLFLTIFSKESDSWVCDFSAVFQTLGYPKNDISSAGN